MTSLIRTGFSWLLKAHTGLVAAAPKLFEQPRRLEMYWRGGMVVAGITSLVNVYLLVCTLLWLQKINGAPTPMLLDGAVIVFWLVGNIVILSVFLQTCCRPSDVYSQEERVFMGVDRWKPMTLLEIWVARNVMPPDKQRLHRAWLLNRCLPAAAPAPPVRRL